MLMPKQCGRSNSDLRTKMVDSNQLYQKKVVIERSPHTVVEPLSSPESKAESQVEHMTSETQLPTLKGTNQTQYEVILIMCMSHGPESSAKSCRQRFLLSV